MTAIFIILNTHQCQVRHNKFKVDATISIAILPITLRYGPMFMNNTSYIMVLMHTQCKIILEIIINKCLGYLIVNQSQGQEIGMGKIHKYIAGIVIR